MSEHALHFVIRRGALSGGGRGGGSFPFSLCRFCLFGFFWGLSAQSRKVMVIIPLPSCSATGGRGAFAPPMIFVFVCLFFFGCQLSGRSWPSTPTPLCKFLDKCLKSEKMCRSLPPPPTPTHTNTHTHTHTHTRWRLFQGWRKSLWLAQQ